MADLQHESRRLARCLVIKGDWLHLAHLSSLPRSAPDDVMLLNFSVFLSGYVLSRHGGSEMHGCDVALAPERASFWTAPRCVAKLLHNLGCMPVEKNILFDMT